MEKLKGPVTSEVADPLMEKARNEFEKWKKSKQANKSGFFIIYNNFVEDKVLKRISGNALRLYIYLGVYSKNDTGESWHSSERIAEYFECDKRTVSRWFKELEDEQLIFRIQKGYRRAANTFLKPY